MENKLSSRPRRKRSLDHVYQMMQKRLRGSEAERPVTHLGGLWSSDCSTDKQTESSLTSRTQLDEDTRIFSGYTHSQDCPKTSPQSSVDDGKEMQETDAEQRVCSASTETYGYTLESPGGGMFTPGDHSLPFETLQHVKEEPNQSEWQFDSVAFPTGISKETNGQYRFSNRKRRNRLARVQHKQGGGSVREDVTESPSLAAESSSYDETAPMVFSAPLHANAAAVVVQAGNESDGVFIKKEPILPEWDQPHSLTDDVSSTQPYSEMHSVHSTHDASCAIPRGEMYSVTDTHGMVHIKQEPADTGYEQCLDAGVYSEQGAFLNAGQGDVQNFNNVQVKHENNDIDNDFTADSSNGVFEQFNNGSVGMGFVLTQEHGGMLNDTQAENLQMIDNGNSDLTQSQENRTEGDFGTSITMNYGDDRNFSKSIKVEVSEEDQRESNVLPGQEVEEQGASVSEYSCVSCKVSFQGEEDFRAHACCMPISFFCSKCHKSFRNAIELENHVAQHDANEETPEPAEHVFMSEHLVCKECDEEFFSQASCIAHLKQSHFKKDAIGRPLTCFVRSCREIFWSSAKLLGHFQMVHNLPYNSLPSSTKISLSYAFSDYCSCTICGKNFWTELDYLKHMKAHVVKVGETSIKVSDGGDFSFKCISPGCTESFSTKRSLNDHVKSLHVTVLPSLESSISHKLSQTPPSAPTVKSALKQKRSVNKQITDASTEPQHTDKKKRQSREKCVEEEEEEEAKQHSVIDRNSNVRGTPLKKNEQLFCLICNHSYKQLASYKKHVMKQHVNNILGLKTGKALLHLCAMRGCSEAFSTVKALIKHHLGNHTNKVRSSALSLIDSLRDKLMAKRKLLRAQGMDSTGNTAERSSQSEQAESESTSSIDKLQDFARNLAAGCAKDTWSSDGPSPNVVDSDRSVIQSADLSVPGPAGDTLVKQQAPASSDGHAETDNPCLLCRRGFDSKEGFEFHIQLHQGNAANVCVMCDDVYETPKDLERHLVWMHFNGILCEFCSRISFLKECLCKHLIDELAVLRCKSDGCSGMFLTKRGLEKHLSSTANMSDHGVTDSLEEKVDTSIVGVPEEKVSFESIAGQEILVDLTKLQKNAIYSRDLRNDDEDEQIVADVDTDEGEHKEETNVKSWPTEIESCCFCKRSFLSSEILLEHKTLYHGSQGVKCQYQACSEVFPNRGYLKEHVRLVHLFTMPFKCDKEACTRSFMHEKLLKKHKQEDHVYQCKDCVFSSALYKDFLDHVELVHRKKPFLCQTSDCSASFMTLEELKGHVKTEHWVLDSTLLPYKCELPWCNLAFLYKKDITKHRRKVHKKYYSELAQQNAKSNTMERTPPVRKRNGPRVCHLCDKVVMTEWQLAQHHEQCHEIVQDLPVPVGGPIPTEEINVMT